MQLPLQLLLLDQFLHGATQVFGHTLDDRVALRVNGGVVQRILSVRNTEEAGTLLEGFRPHARHLHQCFSGSERTMFRPVVDDVLSQGRP